MNKTSPAKKRFARCSGYHFSSYFGLFGGREVIGWGWCDPLEAVFCRHKWDVGVINYQPGYDGSKKIVDRL